MLAPVIAEMPAPEPQLQPAIAPAAPTVQIFGRAVKVYDPLFPPTAWVLNVLQRLKSSVK